MAMCTSDDRDDLMIAFSLDGALHCPRRPNSSPVADDQLTSPPHPNPSPRLMCGCHQSRWHDGWENMLVISWTLPLLYERLKVKVVGEYARREAMCSWMLQRNHTHTHAANAFVGRM